MNPFRLGSILLVSAVLSDALPAQKIVVVGATPDQCAFATKPLIRDLKGIGLPKDWTIAVACTPHVWESLRRKGDSLNTVTAFTYMESRTTVLNGEIYRQSIPLQGTMHITPRSVLEHEYGHILCNCDDEAKADKAADLRDSHRP
jgi:hypothetical protein